MEPVRVVVGGDQQAGCAPCLGRAALGSPTQMQSCNISRQRPCLTGVVGDDARTRELSGLQCSKTRAGR